MAEVAHARIGGATHLIPPGPLVDAAAVDDLRVRCDACLAARELDVHVDFSRVSLIGSAALEILADTQARLNRCAGRLTILNPSPMVAEVLAVTELDGWILHGDTAPEQTPAPRFAEHQRLGEMLKNQALIDDAAIADALARQESTGSRFGRALVDGGKLSEWDLIVPLGAQLGLRAVRLRTGLYDPETVRSLDRHLALRLRVAPLFRIHSTIFLATSEPQSIPSFDAVEEATGARVKPVLACCDQILKAIDEAYSIEHGLTELIGELDAPDDIELVEQTASEDFAAIDQFASGSPVINLINGLVQRAVHDGASDIHIEPSRTRSRIRFRIDGVLQQVMSPSRDIHPALVSRLKVMANLDIAERRLPQDGRIQVYTQGRIIDLRFSSLPGIFGEKIVLRVLDKDRSLTDIDRLGMTAANLATFERLLACNHGLLLATGPTGSGKTTTLYGAIQHLDSVERSIVTIEDPVEYQLDRINQNQVRDQVGLSFARMLKHVLRQDPDIVMVGEIRERETAEIAVQAALTGHLVLSTLHTNDSVGAITRLLDMGIEPYLLSSALIGVIAQRLIRTVCSECRTSVVAQPELLARLGVESTGQVHLQHGRGCPVCYDSGYKGRMAIHEILVCDAATQRLMISNPTQETLTAHLQETGVLTLRDDGVARALEGRTTLEEVARMVQG